MQKPRRSNEDGNQRHLQWMRANGYLPEPPAEETRISVTRFLIVCEGENTEPWYFRKFRVPSNSIEIEPGCGSKTALVERAKELAKKDENIDREVWCVFDMDIKPDEAATQPEDFNNAIATAEASGMHVAWSNDAFELWFLLHYQHVDTALTRKEIFPILKEKWGLESFSKEAKREEFCKGAYDRHGGDNSTAQQDAIKRARTLHESYEERTDYASQCPCTTVYRLVERLNDSRSS